MRIAWDELIDDARGYLFLEDDEPVPVDELIEQAKSNGWGEREARQSLRETDMIIPAGDDPSDGVIHTDECEETTLEPESPDPGPGADTDVSDESDALEAFESAIEYFHNQLDAKRTREDGRITTAREYFEDERGWASETVERARLGWAPADETALRNYLQYQGFNDDAIRGTGLFTEDLRPLWRGRHVFPYFDDEDRPVYAISRTADHPGDWLRDQKYAKAVKTKDYSEVDEPIYGLETIQDGEPVLVTEGIADAITAHEAGYPCVSPVTTRFKHDDRERLLDVLDGRDVPRVYVVQDAEPPSCDLDDEGRLTVEQFGEGTKGAVDTAAYLAEHGGDARVGELPRPGYEKVDLDDYLQRWTGEDGLRPILASAKPADQHPAYETGDSEGPDFERRRALDEARETYETGGGGEGTESAVFDLDFFDVSGLSEDYRGKNPLGHHGDSENYFTVTDEDIGEYYGYDHKRKVAYLPLPYLLCEAGERRPSSPNGPLSDREVFVAWRHAKNKGLIPNDDPIPRRALVHVAIDSGLCERDDIEDGWKLPSIDVYNSTVEAVEDEYGIEPGREAYGTRDGGQQYGIEICEPPIRDADVLDIDERRAELQGSRLDATLENDTVTVWADEAGIGKTTNANIGIAERDERHNDLFHNHRKAREFLTDDVTPDGYDHLKGSDQPRHDCCMDAQVEAGEDETPECPTHGHPSEWEHMLPIYDRPKDDDLRKQFDALLSEVKTRRAIEILELDGGAWEEQFDGLEHTDRLAGVHEYLPLRTATRNRLNIIDEAPKLTATDRTLSVEDLTRMANSLEDVASVSPNDETFQELARFARAIVDLITTPGARLDSTDLAALEPPEIEGETIEVNADDGTADSEVAYVETERVEVDPDDLPDDVDPENVERGHKKEIVDPTGGQYKKVPYHFVERERAVVERELLGEEIATAKVEYGETVLNRMRRDEWNGEPLSIDPLLAAAAAAGLDRDAVMQAVAVSTILEYCPWCHSQLESYNGARVCGSDGCDWHEEHNTLTRKDGERARSMAWIKTDESDAPVALQYRELPLLSELPDPEDTLVLDATADPQKIRAWICDEDDPDPVVMGDGPIDMPGLHVTQVADGQYHASTIDQSETARERIQSAIDTGAQVHEQPLYVVKKGLIPLFDFPENGEVLHYHALRGLNRSDFDAVFCIGAPHPDMDDIRRQAEPLAMGRDDIRVGGEEHSTRRNAPNPPVYRKLYYEDEDGKGRAVPTKHYTGMVGRLFRENREREIEQALHRIRPVLADEDEQKHAYLLTNVPTDLPVDDLVSFEELADPLEALVPVPERAIELLEAVRDVSAGNAPDGFRAEALIEQREDGTVANKVAGYHRLAQLNGMDVSQKTVYDWVHALEEIGLLRPETYEQRRGVSYTADFSTLKSALSVLSGNGSFKVAAKRRLKALLAESAGSLGWLEWARDEFGLRGDRCTHRGDDGPPPSPS